MREILFKGKTEQGEWIFGFYHNETSIESPASERKITRHHIYTQDFDKFVMPETVGQFTGLTDKNGKKIFEGDIIYGAVHWLERYKKAVVTFQDGSFGLEWYRGNVREFNAFTSMCNVEYEIIGNVHNNPELLGE